MAVACYVARAYYDLDGLSSLRSQRRARGWWTAGCVVFLVHVVCAFHFEHRWDHSAAFEATAKRTAEMTGWKSGIGLFVNEAFLCMWLIDTVLWWRNLGWPQYRWPHWTVQFLFAFLMFQATFVFGPPMWKIVVPVLGGVLILKRMQINRRISSKRIDRSPRLET